MFHIHTYLDLASCVMCESHAMQRGQGGSAAGLDGGSGGWQVAGQLGPGAGWWVWRHGAWYGCLVGCPVPRRLLPDIACHICALTIRKHSFFHTERARRAQNSHFLSKRRLLGTHFRRNINFSQVGAPSEPIIFIF